MKPNISVTNRALKIHKSYSPEEIIAAGGATAFGHKMGNDNQKLIKALENLPQIEPFTKSEWEDLLDELIKDK